MISRFFEEAHLFSSLHDLFRDVLVVILILLGLLVSVDLSAVFIASSLE